MGERRVSPQQIAGALLLIAMLVGIGIGGRMLWERATDSYVVERADDGRAVTEVVRATFSGASQLKVGSLSGSVQASASDARFGGLLTSDQVIKAPFSVDYFIDVSRLSAADYRYDPKTRVLVIDAPEVTASAPNVDEARRTLSQTRGVFVTRGAFEKLSQRVSAAATGAAQAEARKPERLAQARDNARRALHDLLAPPLKAAGAGDVRVLVTFPFDRRPGDRERWDESRRVEDVVANRF